MFNQPLFQISTKTRTGIGQWTGEAVATFGLVLTILGTVRHRAAWVPVSVALYITAAYWFTSSTSFANPAITIARSLSNSFAGIAPVDVPGFIFSSAYGWPARRLCRELDLRFAKFRNCRARPLSSDAFWPIAVSPLMAVSDPNQS